jgi:hypothetical protein
MIPGTASNFHAKQAPSAAFAARRGALYSTAMLFCQATTAHQAPGWLMRRPTCCQPAANLLPTCCQPAANLLPAEYYLPAS